MAIRTYGGHGPANLFPTTAGTAVIIFRSPAPAGERDWQPKLCLGASINKTGNELTFRIFLQRPVGVAPRPFLFLQGVGRVFLRACPQRYQACQRYDWKCREAGPKVAKAQPQPRGPSPGRGVAGVPCTARGRGQAVAGKERWFPVFGFRFSVKEQLQKLLPSLSSFLAPGPWPLISVLKPCTWPWTQSTCGNRASKRATSGASPVHCCQG